MEKLGSGGEDFGYNQVNSHLVSCILHTRKVNFFRVIVRSTAWWLVTLSNDKNKQDETKI
jgi:hypothetical protein